MTACTRAVTASACAPGNVAAMATASPRSARRRPPPRRPPSRRHAARRRLILVVLLAAAVAALAVIVAPGSPPPLRAPVPRALAPASPGLPVPYRTADAAQF